MHRIHSTAPALLDPLARVGWAEEVLGLEEVSVAILVQIQEEAAWAREGQKEEECVEEGEALVGQQLWKQACQT